MHMIHSDSGMKSKLEIYMAWIAVALLLLTNWSRVTHMCDRKLTIIGSDNGLSPGQRQAIIWTSVGI